MAVLALIILFRDMAEVTNNTAEIILATGTAISAIGTIGVAVLVQLQRRTLGQVEKQGNSVSLELCRVNAVYARRLAVTTKDPADEAVAADAEAVYLAAKQRADKAG